MSSSEEYLDNLLKSLMEGNSDSSTEPAQESSESDMSGAAEQEQETEGLRDDTSSDYNEAMSADDITAMFASMDEGTAAEKAAFEDENIAGEFALDDAIPEELLPEELIQEENGIEDADLLADGAVFGEESLFDAFMQNEESAPDGLSAGDGLASDDFVLDDNFMPEESLGGDEMPSDEFVLDGDSISDGPAFGDEALSDEFAGEESFVPEEFALEEGLLPDEELTSGDGMEDDFVLDEASLLEEPALGDEAADDFALEEGLLDDLGVDEALSDDFALEEGEISDELLKGEGSPFDDFALEEGMLQEESMPDRMAEEEPKADDFGLDDLLLDDLGLGDLGLEESMQGYDRDDDADMDSDLMDHFALEESGDEDADLSALLAGMGDNEALSEINDLLEKSEQGVSLEDDDMLAMLSGVSDDGGFDLFAGDGTAEGESENIREVTPEEPEGKPDRKEKRQKRKEEKERKKQEKKAKKTGGKKNAQTDGADNAGDDELSGLLGDMAETGEEPKKQGFFSRILDFLLEEEEEESDDLQEDAAGDMGLGLGNISDENKQLLAELKEEDKQNAKKKDKKGKKEKKAKKDKKGKKKGEEAEGEGEEGAEVKEKKPKKERKKKKEKNVEEEPQKPEKKLSRKRVTSVFLFCATLAACIVMITMLLPVQFEKQEARVAYDHNQYEQAYDLLYGKKLSEEDEILLKKSSIILQVKRKVDSFENYQKMEMPVEAFDALLEGMRRYQNLIADAEMYRINGEMVELYDEILTALADNYGISEEEALDIIASGDDMTYSQRVQAAVYGDLSGADGEDDSQVKKDVLPEEEEIIDRLEGTEESLEEMDGSAPEGEEAAQLQSEDTPELDEEMMYDEDSADL